MQDLVIVGAGGHGREVLQLVRDINAERPRWNVLGFADDSAAPSTLFAGIPVLGGLGGLAGADFSLVVAIGSPATRKRVVQRLLSQGNTNFASLIHPSACIGDDVKLGAGIMVCATAILTANVVVAGHVLVNTAAIVSHDCVLADYVTLAPRVTLCGKVTVGEGADLGASATVTPGRTIGEWSKVGAAACVVTDVPANHTVVGVPARSVRTRDLGWQG